MKYSLLTDQNLSSKYVVSTWSIMRFIISDLTSSCPSLEAICKAVYRSFVVESTAAPWANNNITMSTLPNLEAIWSGVCFSCEKKNKKI